MKKRISLLVILMFISVEVQAASAGLYAWDTSGENLYTVDPAGPTATLVGGANPGIIAEIEYVGPFIYGTDTGDNTLLREIDPITGLYTSTTVMTFPPEGNVITSLEYVGSTLYGGLTTEGGGADTYLATIDISTGVVTTIGATGVGSPLGGLAWNGTTIYAISAGGSAPRLFTVDLVTGAATFVGNVTLVGGGSVGGTTALEFGGDGVLYALPNLRAVINGHLLSIDPVTGEATDLGDTGVPFLVALTSDPEFAIEVDIDIKFCSDPNAFNCKKKGVLPVTIFGTEELDVAAIDPSSLQLCTADLSACTDGPRDWSFADRGDPTSDLGAAMCALVDGVEQDYLTMDDFDDMDAAFEASEVQDMLGEFCGADKGAVSEALIITGTTFDGTPIYSVPFPNVGTDQLWKVNK